MKSILKCGVCVSCGRASRNFNRVCPYCGEMVWQPRLTGALRAATLAVTYLLCLRIAFSGGHDLSAWLRVSDDMPGWARFAYAYGIAIMLLPANDCKQVLASTRALWHFQIFSVVNRFLICAPMLWLGLFMQKNCVTPFGIARVLAAVSVCFFGMYLRKGITQRSLVASSVFLVAGVLRILV